MENVDLGSVNTVSMFVKNLSSSASFVVKAQDVTTWMFIMWYYVIKWEDAAGRNVPRMVAAMQQVKQERQQSYRELNLL